MTTSSGLTKYLATIHNIEVLGKLEFNKIHCDYTNGNHKAKEILIRHNLRLVVSIAKKYAVGDSNKLLELIQEGNMGLIRAIDRFDPNLGYGFSTFATPLIKYKIQEFINLNTKIAKTPEHQLKFARKVKKIITESNSSTTEIACILGVDEKDVINAIEILTPDLSIDFSYGTEGEENSLSDTIAGEYNIESQMTREQARNWINLELEKLKANQRNAIILAFGLNGDEALSGAEIGRKMNLTRERVRQLIASGTKQIQASAAKKNIDMEILIQ